MRGEKKDCGNQVVGEKKKNNCGNQVAKIVGEKKGIVATKLPKMREKKKKKSSCRKMFPMACKLFHIFCELVATSTPTVAPVMLVLPYLPSTK